MEGIDKAFPGAQAPSGCRFELRQVKSTPWWGRTAPELGIGIIHQELNLIPHLSVAQNIFIGREPRRGLRILLDEKKINRRTEVLLKTLHLDLDPASKWPT